MEKDFQDVVISVVVPTYQGADKILLTLNSLAQQTFKRFETIVVIDGSTDETARLIQETPLSLNLVVITQINSGRAAARNAGALKATTDVLVFFDDDIDVSPETLEQYFRCYQEGQRVIVGNLYPIFKKKNEFCDYASYLNEKWKSTIILRKGVMEQPYLTACNFLIQKTLFVQLGGFNNALKDLEDFDLAVRLFENGIALYFHPEIKGGHLIQDSFQTYIKRLKQYRIAQQALLQQNPFVKKYIPATSSISSAKKILFHLFGFKWLVRCIDWNFFKVIPKSVRFKVYDFILTANVVNTSSE